MPKFTQLVNYAPQDSDTGFKANVLNYYMARPKSQPREQSASLLTPEGQCGWQGARLEVSLEGLALHPHWAAESRAFTGLSPHSLPAAASYPPFTGRWRLCSSALMVSVTGCGSMFYERWGWAQGCLWPHPGSTCLAAGRGPLEQFGNYLVGGGREGPGGCS